MKTRNELINEVKALDLTQFITDITESKDLSTLQAPSFGNTFKPTDN